LLAGHDPASGAPRGMAVDLAYELGRHLGNDVELVTYQSAGRMADAAASGGWDAAFLAADPARAVDITFTTPYLEIEATYLVAEASPLRTIRDVDRPGVQIALSEKSAYDFALRDLISRATLVRAPSVDASVDMFFFKHLDALAGLRPLLVDIADTRSGFRVIDGKFASIHQAIGIPHGRDVTAYETFVGHAKRSGLVKTLIAKHHVRGVAVAS
jgi:polar amino acid transport system substrate-binding protein